MDNKITDQGHSENAHISVDLDFKLTIINHEEHNVTSSFKVQCEKSQRKCSLKTT